MRSISLNAQCSISETNKTHKYIILSLLNVKCSISKEKQTTTLELTKQMEALWQFSISFSSHWKEKSHLQMFECRFSVGKEKNVFIRWLCRFYYTFYRHWGWNVNIKKPYNWIRGKVYSSSQSSIFYLKQSSAVQIISSIFCKMCKSRCICVFAPNDNAQPILIYTYSLYVFSIQWMQQVWHASVFCSNNK